jgi:hypothetical protein
MRAYLLSIATLALSACASTLNQGAPEHFSPRELNGDLSHFDGATLIVRGFVAGDRCLYQSRRRWRQWEHDWEGNAPDFEPADYTADGMTLVYPANLAEDISRLVGMTITFRGIFKAHYLDENIDFGACARTALILDEGDVRRLIAEQRERP